MVRCRCGGIIVWEIDSTVGPNFQVTDDDGTTGLVELVGKCDDCNRTYQATLDGDINKYPEDKAEAMSTTLLSLTDIKFDTEDESLEFCQRVGKAMPVEERVQLARWALSNDLTCRDSALEVRTTPEEMGSITGLLFDLMVSQKEWYSLMGEVNKDEV